MEEADSLQAPAGTSSAIRRPLGVPGLASRAAGAGELTGEQRRRSRPPLTTSHSTALAGVPQPCHRLVPRSSRSSEMVQSRWTRPHRGWGSPSSLLQRGAWGGGGSSRTTRRDCPLRELQGTGPWSGRPRAPRGTGPLHKCSLKREESQAELQGLGSLSHNCLEQL